MKHLRSAIIIVSIALAAACSNSRHTTGSNGSMHSGTSTDGTMQNGTSGTGSTTDSSHNPR